MTTFEARQPALQYTALRGPWGTAWGASLGASKDVVVLMAKLAVKSGFILPAPEDALGRHGADVALPRVPLESDEEYRARIADAWGTWPWAGTRHALETVAAQFDFAGVSILTAREWGMSDASTYWARWWLLVTLGTPFSPDGAWDDAGTWGDGGTWDSDAPPEFLTGQRNAFRRFTNARDRGFLRFGFYDSTDYYGDGGLWDGTDPDDVWTDEPAFLELEI